MGVDMQRARYDTAAKLRAIDAPEPDLLEALEDRDRCLYNLVSMARRYRTILSEEIQHLLHAARGQVQQPARHFEVLFTSEVRIERR